MNHHSNESCVYCGSTLYKRSGRPHCSGDNIHYLKSIFDKILDMDQTSKDFSSKLTSLRENEEVFDLFMSYWNIKKVNQDARLECIHEETYWRTLEPENKELPMPSSNTPYPDLAEVYLAEIMLGRELTPEEKEGTKMIPKIGEDGIIYRGYLTWILFPRSYMSTNKATDEILSLEPLPKIFDLESIRGIFKDD